MKIAVLSDIHANLEAFQTVMADLKKNPVDRIVHLGDLVGYGPDPEQVVTAVRKGNILTVVGNHDLAVSNPVKLQWFNPIARDSLLKTKDLLSADSLKYLGQLKRSLVIDNIRFVHGFPPCSPIIYLFQVRERPLRRVLEKMVETVCFVGHTHDLETVRYHRSGITREALNKGITRFDPEQKYIFNIGSVGQPRDGTSEAKYVVWDTIHYTLDLRCIPYDVKTVAQKILAVGLPKSNAARLLAYIAE